jgi:hypothetical protein
MEEGHEGWWPVSSMWCSMAWRATFDRVAMNDVASNMCVALRRGRAVHRPADRSPRRGSAASAAPAPAPGPVSRVMSNKRRPRSEHGLS